MKGINTTGQALTQEALPPIPPQGAGYFTLRSRHSLGNGTGNDSATLASLGNEQLSTYPCIGGFHFTFIDSEHLSFPHNPRATHHEMPYHVWAGMEENIMHDV
jgi:hypothetical protein